MAGDRQKARGDIPSSSPSSSELSNFSLDDLQELLIEVLLRLPNFKSAFHCKCVCKNWYSLISTPYFVRRFITHHSNNHYNQKPSAPVINYKTKYFDYELFTISDDPIFKSPGFELNYLLHDHEKIGRIEVVAIYKDLMLCSEDREDNIFRSFVCNPFTKQCVALPLLEVEKRCFSITNVGFVCESYYFEDSQGEYTLNPEYRLRVVHISKDEKKRFILWTYCSETQKWDRSVLEEGREYGWIGDVVAYNGKVLCWNIDMKIFAYDPFNLEISSFVDFPFIESIDSIYCGDFCVGVCRGFVRIMLLVACGTRKSLAIWELKDYATREWSLEKKVYLDTMRTGSSLVKGIVSDRGNELRPLGFHSGDRDVVYLYYRHSVISCNMMTSKLKMVGRGGLFSKYLKVFNIEFPLWATPIHKPIEIRP